MTEKKMDQKEYLKKYLSGEVGGHAKKKKKKKNKPIGQVTVTIVDDDFDISKLANATEEELDNYTLGEDLPQIAGIIDERPPEIIAKESGKWKSLVENESHIESNSMHANNSLKQLNESSHQERNDIDVSSSHGSRESSNRMSKKSVHLSPKRKSERELDASPPRRLKKDSNVSAARKSRDIGDLSPKRKSQRDPDTSPPRRLKRGSDSSPNPGRKNNFDLSPRRSKRSADYSPRRRERESSSVSPRRHSRRTDDVSLNKSKKSPDLRKLSKRSRWDTMETTSRNSNKSPDHNPFQRLNTSNDKNIDSSPPRRPKLSPDNHRKTTGKSLNNSEQRKSNHSPDSSPRRRGQKRDFSPRSPTFKADEKPKKITKSDSPPPTHKKMIKTLDGKVSGLQDAKALRDENEKFKKQEEEMFKQMAEKYKDGDSQTVRDRKTGRRRNVFEDAEKEREKLMKEDERKKTYSRWGAGLKQIEDFKDRVMSETHEMNKPMARYADDKDLENHLRNQCRDGDPMAEYFRKKQKENASGPSVPIYQGAFPENRFNIRPGYRWDGVDRSNGYEKKWFDVQSKKKAVEEEAYKYSVEDM